MLVDVKVLAIGEGGLDRAALSAGSLVLEAVPAEVAGEVTVALGIPTIGIGAGSRVDGQVLVLQDLLGVNTAFRPKFVRTWLDGSKLIRNALQAYHNDVTSGAFPNGEESYR